MPSFIIDEIHVGDIVQGEVVLRNVSYGDDMVQAMPYIPESGGLPADSFVDQPVTWEHYGIDPYPIESAIPAPVESNDFIGEIVEPVAPAPVSPLVNSGCPMVSAPLCPPLYMPEAVVNPATGCKTYTCKRVSVSTPNQYTYGGGDWASPEHGGGPYIAPII